jgi:undecaprenyl pyrophosphate phosphatase UppP
VDSAQAIILGLIEGITELSPRSSLSHSVILPAMFGWTHNPTPESFFLVFLVGLTSKRPGSHFSANVPTAMLFE